MLKYFEISFSYKALTDIYLNEFKGSAIRGALGFVMKRKFCSCKGPYCKKPSTCIYGKLFEARNTDLNKPMYGMKITKPYVFYSDDIEKTNYSKDELLHFNAIVFGTEAPLLGSAIVSCLPDIDSIGKRRSEGFGKIQLESFETKSQEFPNVSLSSELSIEFVSPAIIQRDGKIVKKPTLRDICMAMARKTQNIKQFYYSIDPKIDFELITKFDSVPIESSASEILFSKWSAKRGTREVISGFKGKVVFKLPDNPNYNSQLSSLVSICSVSGIGLRSSHGFGRFILT